MKPLIRGYIHTAAFFIALAACGMLLARSHGAHTLIPNLVYSISLIGLYGISALYHCPMWNRPAYLLIRRIDHAAIYALIAGTATPICLIGLKGKMGMELLIIMWVGAIVGMMIAIFWSHSPKWIRAIFYVILGWACIPFIPEIKSALGVYNMKLLINGGLIYSLGAVVYAFKHPDPFPRVLGYHEIFHILVVIASGFHFVVIYNL